MKQKDLNGVRLDKWLRAQYPLLSGRHIDEAIGTGLVLGLNGRRLKKGSPVLSHLDLNYRRLEEHLEGLRNGNASLVVEVIAHDGEFLIIDKPAGIASQPVSLFDLNTVTHWLLANYPVTREAFVKVQPIVTPHRLDKGTSGILVVALTPSSMVRWREKFTKKEVSKKYLAWCWGTPRKSYFEISSPIAHSKTHKGRMIAVVGVEEFRPPIIPATSRVKRMVQRGNYFLAEVSCETGATHQIRVHMALAGFPLLGDRVYDPLFHQRQLKPAYHQLRAIEIRTAEQRYSAPSEVFCKSFSY